MKILINSFFFSICKRKNIFFHIWNISFIFVCIKKIIDVDDVWTQSNLDFLHSEQFSAYGEIWVTRFSQITIKTV